MEWRGGWEICFVKRLVREINSFVNMVLLKFLRL